MTTVMICFTETGLMGLNFHGFSFLLKCVFNVIYEVHHRVELHFDLHTQIRYLIRLLVDNVFFSFGKHLKANENDISKRHIKNYVSLQLP